MYRSFVGVAVALALTLSSGSASAATFLHADLTNSAENPPVVPDNNIRSAAPCFVRNGGLRFKRWPDGTQLYRNDLQYRLHGRANG